MDVLQLLELSYGRLLTPSAWQPRADPITISDKGPPFWRAFRTCGGNRKPSFHHNENVKRGSFRNDHGDKRTTMMHT